MISTNHKSLYRHYYSVQIASITMLVLVAFLAISFVPSQSQHKNQLSVISKNSDLDVHNIPFTTSLWSSQKELQTLISTEPTRQDAGSMTDKVYALINLGNLHLTGVITDANQTYTVERHSASNDTATRNSTKPQLQISVNEAPLVIDSNGSTSISTVTPQGVEVQIQANTSDSSSARIGIDVDTSSRNKSYKRVLKNE